jgi:hypothetical protein
VNPPIVHPPSRSARLKAAVAIGLASAVFTGFCLLHAGALPDFPYWWTATRLLLAGENPYTAAAWPYPDPFFYPLPALLPIVPIAWLPMPLAGAVFLGISGGLLAWFVSRESWWRLWIFAGAPYLMALKVGQWSPLLLCVAFAPSLGWLAPAKPQLGLASLLHRPSLRGFLLAAAVTLGSLLVLPGWVSDWRANLARLEFHPAPIALAGGWLLLLGAVRWRTAEGRVFLALACLPQMLFFADQLALGLVARTRKEQLALSAASLAAFAGWFARLERGDLYVVAAAPWVLGGVYAPACVLLLRHAWLDRAATRARTGDITRG